jgi:predicted esterase
MVADEFGMTRPMIYVGFSQGVAMAFRAAALVQRPCDGVVALASDVPPDVAPLAGSLPKVLLGRGDTDEFYPAGQAAKDLELLRTAEVPVTEHVFEGGHQWSPVFIEKCGAFVDELIG